MTAGQIAVRPLHTIRPSPENDTLYSPIRQNDPEIQSLADSIRRLGVREPLVVTQDGYILSGHRRWVAAGLAGLSEVPCRVDPVRRCDDLHGFVQLLREHNRQRNKSRDEQLREEAISIDPDEAYDALRRRRMQDAGMPEFEDLTVVDMAPRIARAAISKAKEPLIAAVIAVANDRRKYWPLSVRQIHYALLNDPPLKHASKPDSRYVNDGPSYDSLTDLVGRARIQGRLPWEAISDDTRPVVVWTAFANVQAYLQHELPRFLSRYWRDYQRSQPCHVEVVVEKLTVQTIVQPVVAGFMLPLTVGRGYASLCPRHEMAIRFRRSGKERLIVLLATDFDPDGEGIAESFARSMRDDFGVAQISPYKVALTASQVRELRLPPRLKAKSGSAQYEKFTQRYGDDVFELEAIPPATLQDLLRAAIVQVLDSDALRAERDAERADAAFLAGVRQRVLREITGLTDGVPQ